jgi:hypothetical protein
MSIDVRFLHDFPNSIITELEIGTDARERLFTFGARYPILFIKSFEMSVL